MDKKAIGIFKKKKNTKRVAIYYLNFAKLKMRFDVFPLKCNFAFLSVNAFEAFNKSHHLTSREKKLPDS